MKANIAYKFELMPTREQKRIFAQAAGCRRFVWNKAIELQKRCLEQEVPFLKYTELAGGLVLWKKEDDMLWLQEAPSQALQQCLQQCLMDASAAIEAFKAKKKGFPKFQARGDGDSFRIPHSASSPDGLGRSQRSSPHPEGRLRAIQKVASDSRQDQADDGFRRMRALVCLGRDGDGFRQRRSASSRRGRH